MSLGWGPWARPGGMIGGLSERQQRRMARLGTPALPVEQGLALFDAALACDEAVLLPVRLDLPAIRSQGEVPPLLRGLVRKGARPAVMAGARAAALVQPPCRLGGAG